MREKLLFLWIILALAAAACSLPAVDQTPGATTTPAVTPTAPGLPSSAAPVGEPSATVGPQVTSVRFFLVALEDGGQNGIPVGCGDSLVAVDQPVEPTGEPITAALERLFSYKTANVGESGLYTALWQSNLMVESVQIDSSGKASVSLTGNYRLGGTCDTPRFVGQIEQTILATPGVESAAVLLNGIPIEEALSSQ